MIFERSARGGGFPLFWAPAMAADTWTCAAARWESAPGVCGASAALCVVQSAVVFSRHDRSMTSWGAVHDVMGPHDVMHR